MPTAASTAPHDWQAVVLERIATNAPVKETLDTLIALVEAQIPGAIGSVLLLDPETRRLRTGASGRLPAAFVQLIDNLPIGPTVGSCGTAAFTGKPVIVSDIATDPLWCDFRQLAEEHHLGACWSTPILSRKGSGAPVVLGTFALYFQEPTVPDARAFQVLGRADAIACIALEAARVAADLRESETRFRMFVDHATDAFFVHEVPSGRLIDVNLKACELLGYRREELIGALPQLFDPLADEIAAGFLSNIAEGRSVTFESQHRRKDGTTIPVEVRMGGFESRGRAFALAVARDITERLALEERLRHSQKMEAIGRLAGGVAHDFNNLLTVINMQANLMLESRANDPVALADLEIIRDAGRRGAELTSQLLALGRRTIVSARPLAVDALVGSLAQLFRRLVDERIVFRATLDAPDMVVKADPGLLEQVLMNLVVNARDAMEQGGQLTLKTSRVELGASQPAHLPPGTSFARIVVEDTGEGMTDEVKARMFEPFFTTKPVGKGSGLGLATVYGIVTQAGGQVRVESQPGKGTRVEVLLPHTDEPIPPVPSIRSTGLEGHEVILLAEDQDAVRTVAKRGLERFGYTVLCASDAKEAESIACEFQGTIHVLLTDLVMPGVGGRELGARLTKQRADLKVIYMSGYTDDDVVREGVTTGQDAFIQKPFTPTALAQKIRSVLRHERV